MTSDYFEQLIEKHLMNNPHQLLLSLEPEKGLTKKRDNEVKKELQDFKKSLTKEELDNLVQATKKLKKKQATPDSKESLESIPQLSRADIEDRTKKTPTGDP